MVTMSQTSRAASRPFRILALPLARLPRPLPPVPPPAPNSPPKVPETASTDAAPKAPTPLMLFQVIQPDPDPTEQDAGAVAKYSKWAMNKASDFWLTLGKKDKKSVMYWFYKRGEGLMDRIEYEEWALKAVHEGQGVKFVEKGKEAEQKRIEVQLLKPTFEDQPLPSLLPKLHRFLIHRIPYHRKMMWRTIIASPLTWPFAIIPVIPNFPLFYVLWRAWSHYKAYRGATYLEQILKSGMIVEKPSKELDEVYSSKGLPAEEGPENVAPDETKTDGIVPSSSGTSLPEKVVKDGEKLVPQAKGEEGSVDGTATPKSMVFDASKSESSETTSSIESIGKKHSDKEVLEVKQHAKGAKGIEPIAKHPCLILRPEQVPVLAKVFDLKPLEIMDVDRAVEQADLRARKIEEANKQKEQGNAKAGSN